MILCREQKNDYLDPEMSMVTLDGDEDAAATFIKEYVGESFYNYHFVTSKNLLTFRVLREKNYRIISRNLLLIMKNIEILHIQLSFLPRIRNDI